MHGRAGRKPLRDKGAPIREPAICYARPRRLADRPIRAVAEDAQFQKHAARKVSNAVPRRGPLRSMLRNTQAETEIDRSAHHVVRCYGKEVKFELATGQ